MHSLYLKSKIGLGFLGLWAGGQLLAAETAPLQLTEEAYQRNHRQYQMLCANCHGAEGKGGLGGSLVDGKWRRGGTPEEVLRSIKTGYPENGMPGYGEALSEAEMRELVAYLQEAPRRSVSEPARKTAGAPPRDLTRVPQLEQGVKIVSEESDFSSGAVYEGS
jgi:mono/diheme cytochrome c family protein